MEQGRKTTTVKADINLLDEAALKIAKLDDIIPNRNETVKIALEFFAKNYKGK